jgi:glycosyltransferase involved in cell wall biosynthesis
MSRFIEFSVVIPTYNRLKFLKEAVASVEAQKHCDYEIIIVDDGSSDGTSNYLESLRGRVRTLHQSHKGPSAARNLGARHAAGTYIAFLDSDDLWFPWTLLTFHEVIRLHKDVSLISAATVEFEGDAPCYEQGRCITESFVDYFETASNPAYVGSNAMVVKRSVFDRIGRFNEKMSVGEDLDLYFRLGTSSNFVRVISPVTLAYRRHSGNISRVAPALYYAATELLKREAEDGYPGGKEREKERCKLLTRMLRPVTLACLTSGFKAEAWQLYKQSFLMNARLGRLRYLVGFPLYYIGIMFNFIHSNGYAKRDSKF